MADQGDLLERGIPDRIDTTELAVPLAAEIDFLAGRTDRWTADATAPMLGARAFALLGDLGRARHLVAGFDVDGAPLHEVVAASWAAARAGPPERALELLDALGATNDEFLVDGVPLGPTALFVGLLHAGLGDLDRAAAELRAAVEVGDGRAPVWGALARVELVRVLRCSAALASAERRILEHTEADRALRSASTFFVAGGYRSLLDRAAALDSNEAAGRAPSPGEPTCGVLVPGERWTIGFGIQPPVDVRRSRGLTALHHLIEHGDRPVPAVELDRVLDGGDAAAVASMSAGDIRAVLDGGGAHVDDELRALLFSDPIRSRVSKLLTRTIAKLGDAHRLLALHLDRTVRTGHVCRYDGAGTHVSWVL